MRMKAFLLIPLFIVLGCQPARKNDPFVNALEKLDRGQYTEAIQDLEVLNAKEQSPKVQMALASAYAGRAGIETLDFFAFAESLQGNPFAEDQLVQRESYKKNQESVAVLIPLLPAETQQKLTEFFLNWAALEIYREKFLIYPYARAESRADLEKAIAVLSASAEPGAKLYSATLQAVLTRSELDDGFDVWTSIGDAFSELLAYPLEFNRILCQPRIGGFTGWMGRQLSRIKTISEDLVVSFPSKAPEFTEFSAPVPTYLERIPAIEANLVPSGCPVAP